MTFAALVGAIEADAVLSPTRRRDLKSAVVTFCRRLNVVATDAPASMAYVRKRLDGVHPDQVGLKPKRWQNVLSEVRFAINRYGPKPFQKLQPTELPVSWKELYMRIPAPKPRYGLSSLIKFCAVSGIAPEYVDETTFATFAIWLEDHTTAPRPERAARDAARLWNKAAEIVPDWPGKRVELKPARDAYCLPWEKITPAFRRDAAAWLRSLGEDNWANDDAPLRPLRPVSIEAHEFKLRQSFSILTRCGHSPAQITSLAYLVRPAHAEQILTFFWERSGRKPSSQAAGIAACLLSIARHRVKLPDPDIRQLQRLKQRVSPQQQGLTSKNRTMLQQFDDARNKERLLMFPIEAMRTATRIGNRFPVRAALLVQAAIAIEILIMMPLRLTNITNLHLEQNFVWRGDRLFIVIQSEHVKNDEPIEFELPEQSVSLIKEYLAHFRPRLTNGSGFLFPGMAPGRPKNSTALSRQITRELFKATGLRVTAHQYRHVAAKIWLDENPGSYEIVRRLLHHRSIDTTTASYTGFETGAAARHYDRFILRQRQRFRHVKGGDVG